LLSSVCSHHTLTTCCVSGVTVVIQNPPLITVNKGETLSLVCNTGITTYSARWYKQTPAGVPQYVLRFYHGWRSSVRYGSDYSLIINNVDVDDSAYSAKEQNSK
uniref:Immunoglobulin V-set domain-containing protein n=1 Tax=Sinocyclocheilus grahami TaxID=75366 RepID=A0A672P924_SINGR